MPTHTHPPQTGFLKFLPLLPTIAPPSCPGSRQMGSMSRLALVCPHTVPTSQSRGPYPSLMIPTEGGLFPSYPLGPQICHVHTCLRAFAPAVPSPWRVLGLYGALFICQLPAWPIQISITFPFLVNPALFLSYLCTCLFTVCLLPLQRKDFVHLCPWQLEQCLGPCRPSVLLVG